jgi:small subunit ribosomal protein S13
VKIHAISNGKDKEDLMARIAGVDLPRNKRMEIALTYVYGIGKATAKNILNRAGVDLNKRTESLEESEIRKIRDVIEA